MENRVQNVIKMDRKFHPGTGTPRLQSAPELLARSKAAASTFALYDHKVIDQIFHDVAIEVGQHRLELARAAVEETERGVFEDKVIKNLFASENIFHSFKHWRPGTQETGSTMMPMTPYGVIGAVLPVTNPTSTAIYKTLMALRTGNAILLMPHPSAVRCTVLAAQILASAAEKAGAPRDVVTVLERPSREDVLEIMRSCDLIWATGGAEMCEAASRTGKPSLLGGPGNCPALIDERADVEAAVSAVILSKTFDHGMICATEQALVVHEAVYEKVKAALIQHGAWLLTSNEADLLAKAMRADGGTHINKKMVGRSAQAIAKIAGLQIHGGSPRVLVGVANPNTIGPDDPWSCEKMAPILGLYIAQSFEEGVEICARLVKNGGVGHIASIHTDPGWKAWNISEKSQDRVWLFQQKLAAGEVLVNIPSALGVVGDIFNFQSVPRLSIQTNRAAGTQAEISPLSLLRVREVVRRQNHHLWVRLPSALLFEEGSAEKALEMVFERVHARSPQQVRVMIISDLNMERLGVVDRIEGFLRTLGAVTARFCEVEPDPSFSTVLQGLQQMRKAQPSAIVAVGGGSVMDAAKLMRLLLDHPEATDLDALEARFMDITKRISTYLPSTSSPSDRAPSTELVCIPTTSGTGAEVSPFAVITDPRNGKKYALADYVMTPTIAAVDPSLVKTLPETQIAAPGLDAITHAIESYVSVLSSNFTRPWSVQSLKLLFTHLRESKDGDMRARALVHEAATLAGMALSNAFVGIAHSIAHQLGARFHIHHGIACAIALPHVIRFNGHLEAKQAYFPQHRSSVDTTRRYSELASAIACGDTAEDLIQAFLSLAQDLKIPLRVRDACSVQESEFFALVSSLALDAFDDQCTSSNPRYPLVSELENLIQGMW